MQAAQIGEELATIKNLLDIQDTQQEHSSSAIVYSSLSRITSTEWLERARPHAREFYPPGTPATTAAAPPTKIPSSPPALSTATVSPSFTFKKSGVNALALSSTSSALASLDAQDVAQYLTLADFNVFKNISPYEYLRGTWRNSSVNNSQQQHELSNPKKSGYARILTRRANMLSHWILHEVCSPQHPKQRRMIIKKLIHIAKLCIEWNNFHTGMIIIMGLQCPTIQRLENTWQALSSRDMSAFDALQKYVDVTNNMGYYRQALATAKAPVVPFFPLILKDLTFFMDGNPTMTTPAPLPEQQQQQQPSPKLINFDKFRVLTHFVNTLMRYTTENYWFASDLEHCPFLPHISITRPCCSSHIPADVPVLDRVAELVEIKIRSVESCYEDSRCSTQWISSNMRRVAKQQLS
ncbi:ras guanine nucleotide exchange factor domain-containing protein [Zychaea mexicana]|uniref:ras guanine nucleotide exchange factor domain-containing protein n=1 Tax=Zychaea mexicana TaxID=64656 RepID=UPI0022FE6954|nr:ras guanine nucleotide exchange factor domain-containing protein [Zychaea mexicana]KAI9498632.1 ras guanine nucleotide exchange factor domain-containing protein [Zychaea mexicana]